MEGVLSDWLMANPKSSVQFSPYMTLQWHPTVMVHFVCQFNLAMGYPDIWLNIILGVSGRAFLDEINT